MRASRMIVGLPLPAAVLAHGLQSNAVAVWSPGSDAGIVAA